MKQLTCSDFLDILNNEYFFSEIHAEMYWDGSFRSEKIFEKLKAEAKDKNVILTDVDEWDYDKELTENYKCDTDKGLS